MNIQAMPAQIADASNNIYDEFRMLKRSLTGKSNDEKKQAIMNLASQLRDKYTNPNQTKVFSKSCVSFLEEQIDKEEASLLERIDNVAEDKFPGFFGKAADAFKGLFFKDEASPVASHQSERPKASASKTELEQRMEGVYKYETSYLNPNAFKRLMSSSDMKPFDRVKSFITSREKYVERFTSEINNSGLSAVDKKKLMDRCVKDASHLKAELENCVSAYYEDPSKKAEHEEILKLL